MDKSTAAITQLADFYNALHAMKEQELTVLAEAHAEDPSLLVRRFGLSVRAVERRPRVAEPFYDSDRKEPPSPPTPIGDIRHTIEFASHLCDRCPRAVKGGEALGFRYVDREIFPARATGEARSPRRSLDLLLANRDDHRPVLAELKIRRDKPAYFALIQVLMHAAELQSPAQRTRLSAHLGGQIFEWPAEGPFADLYIIAFDAPQTGKYRGRSFEATKRISEQLVQDTSFSRYIRRIAYLNASPHNDTIAFENLFAFGIGV